MSLFQTIVRLFQSRVEPTLITADTRIRIERLFPPNEQAQVITILESQCVLSKGSPELLDQVRFSVLKVSDGSLSELLSAVKLASYDWRDIISKAGLGHPNFRTWMPEKKWQ